MNLIELQRQHAAHFQPARGRLGKTAGRCRCGHRHARPHPASWACAQVRPAELADESHNRGHRSPSMNLRPDHLPGTKSNRKRAFFTWGLRPQTPGIYRVFRQNGGSLLGRLAPPRHSAAGSALGVAVGMSIAAHPPRRSVRAELPHTAPPSDTGIEAYVGIWMKSAGTRNPPFEDRPQTIPVWLPPLTAPA